MPNGAKPCGISGSAKPPSVVAVVNKPPAVVGGPNTSIVPARKLVAKRNAPLTLTPNARPLYTAPFAAFGICELSTARTALVAGVRPCVQAEIVPSSVSKMKVACNCVPGTTNAEEGFQIMPVGAAGVSFGRFFGSTVLQSVMGTTLPGNGIFTCRDTIVPSPL